MIWVWYMLIFILLRSFGVIWDHMESFGIIWDHLGSSGMIWDNLGMRSSEIIWDDLGSSRLIWDHLGSSGIIWGHLGSSGIIWGHLGLLKAFGSNYCNTSQRKCNSRRKPSKRLGVLKVGVTKSGKQQQIWPGLGARQRLDPINMNPGPLLCKVS